MNYRLSALAAIDLDAITIYTIDNWGKRQADKYLAEMNALFDLLTRSPALGRAAGLGFPGTRKIEQGSHQVIYRNTRSGVLIVRVLHKRMLPARHRA